MDGTEGGHQHGMDGWNGWVVSICISQHASVYLCGSIALPAHCCLPACLVPPSGHEVDPAGWLPDTGFSS